MTLNNMKTWKPFALTIPILTSYNISVIFSTHGLDSSLL